MKIAAAFMLICMVFISVLPGMGQRMQGEMKMDCCKKTEKGMPCNHQQKQDCTHGMCITRLCCNVSGFVPVVPLDLGYRFAELKGTLIFAYTSGQLSDYSPKSFRPPTV